MASIQQRVQIFEISNINRICLASMNEYLYRGYLDSTRWRQVYKNSPRTIPELKDVNIGVISEVDPQLSRNFIDG